MHCVIYLFSNTIEDNSLMHELDIDSTNQDGNNMKNGERKKKHANTRHSILYRNS